MNRLRETRVIRRVTQFQLAKLAGVYPSKISLIENFHIEARIDEKLKLARALGLNPEDLFPLDQR